MSATAPALRLGSAGRGAAGPGHWHVRWSVQNDADRDITLVSARLPHDRFFAPEREVDLRVPAGESRELEVDVACGEPPGSVVENVFLILRVQRDDESWRVLARLRVVVDAAGVPIDTCELITTHPVGFARGGV